jgi:hypothetical protein
VGETSAYAEVMGGKGYGGGSLPFVATPDGKPLCGCLRSPEGRLSPLPEGVPVAQRARGGVAPIPEGAGNPKGSPLPKGHGGVAPIPEGGGQPEGGRGIIQLPKPRRGGGS